MENFIFCAACDDDLYDRKAFYEVKNYFYLLLISDGESTKAVVQRSSVKRCSQKFRNIHCKTPVPESLFK